MTHDKCGDTCLWPRFHTDVETINTDSTYMGRKLEADFPGRSQETRTVFETEEGQEGPEIVIQKVTQQMKDLVIRLRADLHTEMFTPEVSDTIELTHVICDLSSLARSVKEHGAVVVCLLKAEAFADTMHRLTNSLDHIPKEILQEYFKSFLRSFEVYIGKRGAKDIDSKTVIKDFLRDDKKLYGGNEIILHCFYVVAVKFSVESSVESFISRYECHLFCATVQILSLNLSIYVLHTYELGSNLSCIDNCFQMKNRVFSLFSLKTKFPL